MGPCSLCGVGGEGVPEANCSWVDDAAALALAQQASPPASVCHGDTLLPVVWPLLGTSFVSIGSAETSQNI